MILSAPQTRKMIIHLLAPPVLWSFHFLFVYVFVSLACLWSWGSRSFLGVGVIEWVVALVTLGIGVAIQQAGYHGGGSRGGVHQHHLLVVHHGAHHVVHGAGAAGGFQLIIH